MLGLPERGSIREACGLLASTASKFARRRAAPGSMSAVAMSSVNLWSCGRESKSEREEKRVRERASERERESSVCVCVCACVCMCRCEFLWSCVGGHVCGVQASVGVLIIRCGIKEGTR